MAIDALGAEIMRHALRVAAEEASIVVVRSAHSTMIVEGSDACAAILDAQGRLVALSEATNLMHASSLRCTLPSVIEDHPLDTMRPGDVFVTNDAFRGGIHANDLVVIRPIFATPEGGTEPRPLWFGGTLIHVADLGGTTAGGLTATATDQFAEGLQLPPVRLYDAGSPVRDLHRILALNSRLPDRVLGDVEALVAGVNVIDDRVSNLVSRYGVEALQAGVEEYLDSAERRLRADLARLPAGTFHGEYVIDNDGVELDRRHTIRVSVTLGGSQPEGTIRIDFTGTDPQVIGAVNAGYSQALTGVVYAVRCLADPTIPMNDGCFRPIDVHLPHGSILNPRPPAACGGRVVSVCAAIEAMLAAFAQAMPERAVAASTVIHPYTVAGRTEAGPFVLLSYEYGGIGARYGVDGPDTTGAYHLGGRNVVPQIEPLEATLPLRFERQAFAVDSGGAGHWRGGVGVDTRIRLLVDSEVALRCERVDVAPAGRLGGHDGLPGAQWFDLPDGERRTLPPKGTGLRAPAGSVFVLRTSGGGGLGDPLERDPELVAADVREHRVSRDAARRDYAVVLAADGSVDHGATRRAREDRR